MRSLPALELLLRSNPYPGRGALVARTGDGAVSACYFVTGRSRASRARTFEHVPSGDIAVVATERGEPDPLRHYTAVALRGSWLCLGNGDQVPQIATALAEGVDALTAFSAHGYEPDEPIFTSRVTAAIRTGEAPLLLLGTSRRPQRGSAVSDTTLLAVADLGAPGAGVLATSYQSDGEHVGPAQPYREVRVGSVDHHELLDCVWSALAPEYRVAALTLRVDDPAHPELRTR